MPRRRSCDHVVWKVKTGAPGWRIVHKNGHKIWNNKRLQERGKQNLMKKSPTSRNKSIKSIRVWSCCSNTELNRNEVYLIYYSDTFRPKQDRHRQIVFPGCFLLGRWFSRFGTAALETCYTDKEPKSGSVSFRHECNYILFLVAHHVTDIYQVLKVGVGRSASTVLVGGPCIRPSRNVSHLSRLCTF